MLITLEARMGRHWSLFFIHRRRSGLVLFLLSLALLLFGGGIFPTVIGMIGAAVATRIDAPILWWRQRLSGSAGRFLAVDGDCPLCCLVRAVRRGSFLQRFPVAQRLAHPGSHTSGPRSDGIERLRLGSATTNG